MSFGSASPNEARVEPHFPSYKSSGRIRTRSPSSTTAPHFPSVQEALGCYKRGPGLHSAAYSANQMVNNNSGAPQISPHGQRQSLLESVKATRVQPGSHSASPPLPLARASVVQNERVPDATQNQSVPCAVIHFTNVDYMDRVVMMPHQPDRMRYEPLCSASTLDHISTWLPSQVSLAPENETTYHVLYP